MPGWGFDPFKFPKLKEGEVPINVRAVSCRLSMGPVHKQAVTLGFAAVVLTNTPHCCQNTAV
jgi:hypothetical protein